MRRMQGPNAVKVRPNVDQAIIAGRCWGRFEPAVGHDEMCRAQLCRSRKPDRQRIRDPATGESEFSATEREVFGRQHTGHRSAGPHDVRQSGTAIIRGRKVAGLIRDEVVTNDTKLLNSVVKLVERAGFELLETRRNDTTETLK